MPHTPFTDILLQARREILRDLPFDLQVRFYRLYLLALNRQLEKVRPTDIQTEAEAKDFLRLINLQTAQYAKASELEAKKAIIETIKRTVRAHKDAINAAVAAEGVNISAAFVGVSQEAFENLFIRREMGLTASYKSLSVAQIRTAGREINAALEAMVLDGDSWQRATMRIIDSLTTGDPELRAMARNMGGRVRGLGAWLETATEGNIEAIKRARKIAYDARRIARTEIAHAYHEADRTMSEKNPLIKGIKWNLSPRHPKPDICDVYAKHDFHDMGPGVYPPAYLPPLPHPHDLCFMTHVLHPPGEWRKPQPEPQEAGDITGVEVARYMGGTDNAIRRTVRQINATTEKLKALRQPA